MWLDLLMKVRDLLEIPLFAARTKNFLKKFLCAMSVRTSHGNGPRG